ncbi:hypothetical protein [Conexivisphaera calida]|uniref:hypothetical protein n=1 Tax=Conexivisphaera calida TaxID=1874277 RepID=UPI00157AF448|nr:hypothetical protein [Conexivisphaera calida]
MGMEAPELNVPVVFNLIDRFNKMDRLALSGLEDEVLVILDDDDGEPASVKVDMGSFTRLSRGYVSGLIAIDSSAIPIAYADRKWYLVFSAGVVLRSGGRYAPPHVFRVGPHLAEVGRREGEDQQGAARRLREYVEGSIMLEVLHSGALDDRALILVDGSLRGLSELDCSVARKMRTSLIGISKATKVVPSSMGSLPNGPGYSIISNDGCYTVTAARLEEYGVPLRIDTTDLEGLSSLLSSDVIVRGYPDSLRLAHYSSILSVSEEEAALASLAMHGAALSRPLERREALLGILKVRG